MTETVTLRGGAQGAEGRALGFVASTAIGMASTAPAYSLAATLGFVVVIIGVQTPLFVVLAFIPMFLSAWAIKKMNAVDPDCGTSFTWAGARSGRGRLVGRRLGHDRLRLPGDGEPVADRRPVLLPADRRQQSIGTNADQRLGAADGGRAGSSC